MAILPACLGQPSKQGRASSAAASSRRAPTAAQFRFKIRSGTAGRQTKARLCLPTKPSRRELNHHSPLWSEI